MPKHTIGWPQLLLLVAVLNVARADDVTELHDELSKILNHELGIHQLQKSEIKYEEEVVDWGRKTEETSERFAKIFKQHFEVVRDIRKAVLDSYTEFSRDKFKELGVEQCCILDDSKLEVVRAIKIRGDTTKPCCRFAKNDSHIIPPVSSELIKSMTDGPGKFPDELNILGMKWAYYGDERGGYTIFPAVKDLNGCFVYDPRARPWYAVAASPLPKDIVIVLDMSERSNNTAAIMKEAANTVIDTMNEDDRVGVVFFGGEAITPPDCHRQNLAYAIPATRRFLKDNITKQDTIINGNLFKAGIDKAFELMRTAESDTDRKKAILFMTDGMPQDTTEQVLKTLRERVDESDDEILFLTYGIENEKLDDKTKQLLANMTRIAMGDENSDGKDRFTILTNDTSDLRYKIGRYYRFFTPKTVVDPIVTVPYVDYSGLGLVVSICLPVSAGEPPSLQGVTCVDMTVSDLTLQELNIQQGYMFIFNTENNRTLLHPLLPDPGQVAEYAADPIFLPITNLEPDADKAGIIRQMQQGTNGEKEIDTNWITSRGSSARDGVRSENITAKYYFRKINGTKFTMAVVVPANDRQLKVVENSNSFYPKDVHTCTLDTEVQACLNHGTLATKDFSCIYLSPEAYADVNYENNAAYQKGNVEKYLENNPNYNDLEFQRGVKEMVALTEPLQSIWSNQTSHAVEILWKYVATFNGVMRVFPAINMTHKLSYMHTDWFSKAMDSDGAEDIVISTPRYEDFTGQNIVISLLVNVHQPPKSNDGTSSKKLAVLGMDISLLSIQGILKSTVPDCASDNYRCFLMDSSGYVIFHDSYVRNMSDIHQYLGGKHITQIEPAIAYRLIQGAYMESKSCLSFGSIWRHSTWRMSPDFTSTDQMQAFGFLVKKIPSTNSYLVQISTAGVSAAGGQCVCHTENSAEPGLGVCADTSGSKCQCPCYKKADNFQRCMNKFNDITDPICTPNQTSLLPSKPKWAVQRQPSLATTSEYSLCFAVTCKTIEYKWRCSSFSQCKWCDSLAECVPSYDQCDKEGVHLAAIIVPILLLLAIIVVVAILFYYWRFYKPKAKPVNEKAANDSQVHNESTESIYDDITSHTSDPGMINDTYISTTPPADFVTAPGYVFEAPGAPGNQQYGRRVSSCSGFTPPGPPPSDFPPGSPGHYLTMLDMPPAQRPQAVMSLPPEENGGQRDSVFTVLGPMTPDDARTHRQSMPLPPQPGDFTPTGNRTQSASTLPRKLTPADQNFHFSAFDGGQGVVQPLYTLNHAPDPPPQRIDTELEQTQFPYADIQQILDMNEVPEEYLTMPTSSQTADPPNSAGSDASYLSMHGANRGEVQQFPPQDDIQRLQAQDDIQRLQAQDDIQRLQAQDDMQWSQAQDDIQRLQAQDNIARLQAQDDIQRLQAEDDIQRLQAQDNIQQLQAQDDIQRLQAQEDTHYMSSSGSGTNSSTEQTNSNDTVISVCLGAV